MAPPPVLTVGFLDSGQGDCTIIVYPDNSITLVDCGSIKNGATVKAPLSAALAQYLPAAKNVIANVVLSHADMDHYNQLLDVVGTTPVTNVFYGCDLSLYPTSIQTWIGQRNAIVPGKGAAYYTLGKPDPTLSRAGVDIYVLSANATGKSKDGTATGKNRNAITLLVSFAGVKFFLMADADWWTEQFIITAVGNQKLTGTLFALDTLNVLKMGHHGSAESSSAPWIQAIVPNAVFVSSDTRTFGGTGMPADATITQVIGNSKLGVGCNAHQYVQQNSKSGDFEMVPAATTTTTPFCSTLYNLTYPKAGGFVAEGGSWYLFVTANPTNTSWKYGFTG